MYYNRKPATGFLAFLLDSATLTCSESHFASIIRQLKLTLSLSRSTQRYILGEPSTYLAPSPDQLMPRLHLFSPSSTCEKHLVSRLVSGNLTHLRHHCLTKLIARVCSPPARLCLRIMTGFVTANAAVPLRLRPPPLATYVLPVPLRLCLRPHCPSFRRHPNRVFLRFGPSHSVLGYNHAHPSSKLSSLTMSNIRSYPSNESSNGQSPLRRS